MTTIDAHGRRRMYGFLLVLAGCLLFAVRGYHDQRTTLQSFDFKPVYGSARCLMDGCDPYDSGQIQQEYLQHGGDASDLRPFRPFNANYPPSALMLVVPLALLPFEAARGLWLAIGIVLFSCAALCMADLCRGRRALWVQVLLAVFVASSTMLIMLGQPAMMSISLAVIAVWCFLRQRCVALGVLAFAVSLTFKPHVGGLIWLFFLLSGGVGAAKIAGARGWSYRRMALATLGLTLLLMTPGILLAFHHPASAHWPQELHRNLVGIAAHGSASDPGPANSEVQSIASLQALFSLIRDVPAFYDAASYAVFAPLFLAWLFAVMRRSSTEGMEPEGISARDLVALAAAAALTFLPIYHRQYDTRLMILMFPAVTALTSPPLARAHRWLGWVGVALVALATVATSHQFVHAGDWAAKHGATLRGPVWLAFYRPLPLTLLLLSCFFVWSLFAVSKRQVDG